MDAGTDKGKENRLPKLILSAFRNFAPEVKDTTVRAIEQKCGIKLDRLNLENADRFLAAVISETTPILTEWKAKFVAQVIRNLIQKKSNNRDPGS